MLADGRCCNTERWCECDERRQWDWNCRFLPWISGSYNDDTHVQPRAVYLVDMQVAAHRQCLEQACSNVPRAAVCYSRQHPADMDPCHRLFQALLCALLDFQHQGRRLPTDRHVLSTLGWRGIPRVLLWWQRLLGPELLPRTKVCALPGPSVGLGSPDNLHMGRLPCHVRRRLPGDSVAQEAREQVEKHSQRTVIPLKTRSLWQRARTGCSPRGAASVALGFLV